jgi:hypothetical protein
MAIFKFELTNFNARMVYSFPVADRSRKHLFNSSAILCSHEKTSLAHRREVSDIFYIYRRFSLCHFSYLLVFLPFLNHSDLGLGLGFGFALDLAGFEIADADATAAFKG